MYAYEWTEEYGIYRLIADSKLQKELRPVFHEELDFFGMDEFWDYPKDTTAPLLWAEGIRQYVLNGVRVAEAVGGGFYSKPKIKLLTNEHLSLHPVDTERLYEVNKKLLLAMEQRAIHFIQGQYEIYKSRNYFFVCAFSGGKDSLALLDLTAKALSPDDFYVVFSNTGMELNATIKSVELAKQRWPQLRFAEAKCHMEPTQSWLEFGPPARRMRWCCAVHKSVPTLLKIRELTGEYNARAIVYDGCRADESTRRATYSDVVIGAKNTSQINCHPILHWNTAEIYCYLLHNDIFLNDAYRMGCFRVGCKVCPMSSEWWEGIANTAYVSEVSDLVSLVEDYAVRAKSEKEAKAYIESGGWKARVGGYGVAKGGNRVKESISDNSIKYTISEYTQSWQEVSQILGVTVEDENGHCIQKIDGSNYQYRVIHDNGVLQVLYYPFSMMDKSMIRHLRGIANKVAYCIGCKACIVQCPTGAFNIQPDGKINIRESSCIHCYKCIEFNDRGCLVSDNLKMPEGGLIKMKSLDPYRHFGFRQTWLDHFMEYGLDCFNMNVLGTVQYGALRTWLKESGLITTVKQGKGSSNVITITPLGEKLMHFGAYNTLTWAVIWANVAYNSTISHWYCLNISQGTSFDKDDIVMMLGDISSKSNRANATTALFDTFNNSPIGSGLKQGVPVGKGYVRVGWDTPDAVALLYSLFLYSEHTGRRSFTFSGLINERNNPDATGISPSDIFGIDVKQFRDQIQGLAIAFPKYLRVSFISNLDNIILEPAYTSLDILNLATEQS